MIKISYGDHLVGESVKIFPGVNMIKAAEDSIELVKGGSVLLFKMYDDNKEMSDLNIELTGDGKGNALMSEDGVEYEIANTDELVVIFQLEFELAEKSMFENPNIRIFEK